jgi:hypothetical protein
LASPLVTPVAVRAKIEIVWPHGGLPVQQAERANVTAYLMSETGYDSPPCDWPNLSKDYLAGTAQEDWIPLRPASYYDDSHIDLLLNSRVASLDVRHKRITLADGGSRGYGSLLIATGADPVQLVILAPHRGRCCTSAASPTARRSWPARLRRKRWSSWARASSG